jgi:hypothetical protein
MASLPDADQQKLAEAVERLAPPTWRAPGLRRHSMRDPPLQIYYDLSGTSIPRLASAAPVVGKRRSLADVHTQAHDLGALGDGPELVSAREAPECRRAGDVVGGLQSSARRPPQNFAAFQREAQIQKHMQDKRGRAVRDRYPCFEVRPATTGEILNDSYQGLGAQRAVANPRLPRRAIIDPDRRSPHGLLSWTRAHGGYACHELLLPDLKRALRR